MALSAVLSTILLPLCKAMLSVEEIGNVVEVVVDVESLVVLVVLVLPEAVLVVLVVLLVLEPELLSVLLSELLDEEVDVVVLSAKLMTCTSLPSTDTVKPAFNLSRMYFISPSLAARLAS